ncbi:hypothetical protein COEREDRAFT_90059 [Coemansia reversa NRRL 1564]|uniref:Uncharacterized protein n=1 Tax=Coemansia reversa (strain ATCC 12441 / NRRL 1564) TaxID=763665 RepID=A0A2G5B1A6_COERN|nr:hypothetical protein COEREDRAFT_90059 [Coemansia reversa NRRL 1564]|eukprot:PIA12789.1 hypothetical protein COEREDRAFT_90059 [Coemansia reversa NRRL 1564]
MNISNNEIAQQHHMQRQGAEMLLQHLDQLEGAGSKFFDILAMVGQGPPSLLASQLVTMNQMCEKMNNDAKAALLLNVPVSICDPVFSETAPELPRTGGSTQAAFKDAAELGSWIQETASQTSALFSERRRVAGNVQAALSVPPPKQLKLQ